MKKYVVMMLLMMVGSSLSSQIKRQKHSNWCWAACIQSCLMQDGQEYSQLEIAEDLDDWARNRPAHINEVVGLLRYHGLRAWSVGRPGSPAELYNSLGSGWKLIAFVRPTGGNVGHFILLQEITYDGYIKVSDPATGRTFKNTINDLYYGWRWEAAIVVGR